MAGARKTGRFHPGPENAPLLLPLLGVLRGKRYSFQWSSMLILAYFTEGVVRAWSERGPQRMMALAEIALALIYFTAAVGYARISARTSIESG